MTTLARIALMASFVSAIGFSGLMASEVSTAPQVRPATPSKDLVIRLLSERDERFAKDYEVALILPGETEFQGMTVANAARVTFFGPATKKGQKKRTLSKELFLWNEENGWFLCEIGERLGRTTVFIWSELRGEVEID
ncbi:MAG: hypothetical protein ACSHYB_08915 [Roseibacillus sp.]